MSDEEPTGRPVPFDKIVKAYLKIRDARAERKKEYEAEDVQLKEAQETLQSHMLQQMRELGVNSLRTDYGTAFQTTSIQPTGSDWASFYKWVAENNAFDFLEKRITKTAVSTYMEQNQGNVPPGVTVLRKYEVNVRRKN